MSNAEMLKQLKTSLKALDTAKKAQYKMVGDLIGKLPDDKKKQANDLIKKARKGTVDMSELMAFAIDIRKADQEDLKKSVKRVKKKAKNG